MPIRSSATVSPVLSGLAVDFQANAAGYVGPALFPNFFTAEQSAGYYKFDTKNLIGVPKNLRRAPSAPYQKWQAVLSDDSYSCKEYGLEEAVDDSERKKYANMFDADVSAIRRTTTGIILAREVRIKTLATGASVPTSSPTKKWDETDADIYGDVNTAKKAIEKACGLLPNVMTINRDVFLVMQNHPSIVDRIKYTSSKSVTAEMIAALLEIERLIVAGTVYNSAADGQAASAAYLWGDAVILAHVNPAQDLKVPTFGRTFVWSGEIGPDGIAVESYRDDSIRSDVHRVRQHIDEKICGASLGYHFSDVLST
jgi:hypothetical protein